MKKRFISFLMAIIMAVTLLPLSGCGNNSTQTDESTAGSSAKTSEYITRGEWITMLGNIFGLDEYQGQTPYYKDVDAGSKIYAYVQSCREWKILTNEDSLFRPEDLATRAFVAETAVLAAQLDYTGASGSNLAEQMLRYAAEHGIVAGTDGNANVTILEGTSAAKTAQSLYLDMDIKEYQEVSYSKDTTDLTDYAAQVSFDGVTATMPDSLAAGLALGSIVLLPGNITNPGGIARKVEKMTSAAGITTITTSEPLFEEVFDQFSFASVGDPIINGITTADGVSMPGASITSMSGEPSYYISQMSTGNAEPMAKGLSLNFHVNFTKGTISIKPGVGDFNIKGEATTHMSPTDELGQWFDKSNFIYDEAPSVKDFPENKDGWEKRLSAENKFTGGYEITGDLTLSDLYVETSMDFKKVLGVPIGLNSLSVETNYKVSSNLTLKGKLSEELTIATIPVAVAGGLATVQLQFILYADLTGQLQVKAEVSNNTKIDYSGRFRKTSVQDSSLTAEAAVDLKFGPNFTVEVNVVGLSIIDVALKGGIDVEASASIVGSKKAETTEAKKAITYEEALKASVMLYMPTLSVSVGNKKSSLAYRLKLTVSWNIVTKENCPIQKSLFEKTWVFWTYTGDEDLPPEVANSSSTSGNAASGTNESVNPFASLVLQDAILTVDVGGSKKIVVVSYPTGIAAEDLRFRSRDESIASVDSYGNVTGIAAGTTQISINAEGMSEQLCTITVLGGTTSKNLQFL